MLRDTFRRRNVSSNEVSHSAVCWNEMHQRRESEAAAARLGQACTHAHTQIIDSFAATQPPTRFTVYSIY